jgi:hypothetical protein
MTRLEIAKQAVTQLSAEELKKFQLWFEELKEQLFDEQIERDIKDGKLDKLAERWRADYKAGKFSDVIPPQRPGKP